MQYIFLNKFLQNRLMFIWKIYIIRLIQEVYKKNEIIREKLLFVCFYEIVNNYLIPIELLKYNKSNRI